MSKSEIIGFAIAMSLILGIALMWGVTIYKSEISDSKTSNKFNGGLIVLDRDTAVDSIYIDANLKVIDCVTTKKIK